MLRDLRFGVRTLAKNPGFAALSIVILALGIGANTAIFSGVYTVLLAPFPYPDAGELVYLAESTDQIENMSVSLPNYRDWLEQNRVFERLGAYRGTSFNLEGTDGVERVQGAQISAGALAALGTPPVRGRLFGAAEDRPGGERVALVSEGFLQRRSGSGGDPAGMSLNLDGERFSVVGVLPDDFAFPSPETEVWVPLGLVADSLPQGRGTHPGLYVVARLAEGVSVAAARTEMDTIAGRLAREYPATNSGNRIRVTGLAEREVGEVRPALLVLVVAVGLVLLIACLNVANLLLTRAAGRRRETALRVALGAGRLRLVRQLLGESLVLAFAAGALGLTLAYAGLKLLEARLPPDLPVRGGLGINGWVLGFTLLLALLTGLVFGLLPALGSVPRELTPALAEGAGRGGGSPARRRLRGALVVLELGAALALLIAAGLTVESLSRLTRVDPGFEAAGVLTARVSLPEEEYRELHRWQGFFDGLLERSRSLPGLTAAAVASGLPLAGGSSEAGVIARDLPPPGPGEQVPLALFQVVSPGYFEALGVDVVRGRGFAASDRQEAPPVVVVDETLANQFWPGAEAVGRYVAFESVRRGEALEPRWRRVVGVVRHVRYYELESASRVELYVPTGQPPVWWLDGPPSTVHLILRAEGEPAQLAGPLRRLVQEADSGVPVYRVATMEAIVEGRLAGRRLGGSLLGAFALAALVLAVVGIYGVVSYAVAQRTHEIGVRMALGARAVDVSRMVLREGLVLTVSGLALGLALALAAAGALGSVLYGVEATDPGTLALFSLVLGAVSMLATYLPARRATRVDPITALREARD